MIDRATDLSPLQVEGADWLGDRPGSYIADPPGFGKTRQILAAAQGAPFVTVVAPAAIRDSKVWEREAKQVGFDVPIETISYHQLAKRAIEPGGALVLDEAHRIKSRKVSWAQNAIDGAAVSTRVHLASGTPTPNGYLPELYGQMRLIADYPASYWNWIKQWFVLTSNRYSSWYVPGTLLGCAGLSCADSDDEDCEHREEFWSANVGDLMLRRPEGLLDLPEMSGFDDPIDTPMTAVQKKAYNEMKRSLIADLPDEGITLEALTASQKFVHLMKLTTGVTSVEPDADPKNSGKRTWLEETLPGREHPTVLAVYFRNTALAMARMCEDLGLSYEMFGADTRDKADIVERFQRGEIEVLIASIMVVREGITLTAADQVVLVERSWVPGDNEQTVRRVRRRGQDKPVIVRQLVADGTVDAGQWEALRAKTNAIGTVMSKAEIKRML